MKLVLIGFMGAGKSSVAAVLSALLGLKHIEMDAEILRLSNESSVQTLFDKIGEPAFRDLETTVSRSLSDAHEVVISAGGGAPQRVENVEALRSGGGRIIYLKASFDAAAARALTMGDRPLLRDLAAAKALYQKRLAIYESAADLTVDTEGKTPRQIAVEIASLLGS